MRDTGTPKPSARNIFSAVEQQHHDDDEAINDLSTIFRHLHNRENGLQKSDQEHARHRAEIAAPAPEN